MIAFSMTESIDLSLQGRELLLPPLVVNHVADGLGDVRGRYGDIILHHGEIYWTSIALVVS